MVLLVVAGNSAMRTGNPNTDSQSFLESCCCFFPCLRLYSVGTNFLFGLMDRSIILQVLQVWLVNTMSLRGPLWPKETRWCCWWGTWDCGCDSRPWGCCFSWILAAAQEPCRSQMRWKVQGLQGPGTVGSPNCWNLAEVEYLFWLCRSEIGLGNWWGRYLEIKTLEFGEVRGKTSSGFLELCRKTTEIFSALYLNILEPCL